ncbi:MAG: hypothetical protein FWF76_05225 [Oscillospiraceae bacterium]|nr:hypothetical protein [Oscillospiraceae bacterium]
MTERELKNYTRGIAYQALKFEKGEISGIELITVLKATLGEDVFAEARKILVESQNKSED